jgi:hypothetical protein
MPKYRVQVAGWMTVEAETESAAVETALSEVKKGRRLKAPEVRQIIESAQTELAVDKSTLGQRARM